MIKRLQLIIEDVKSAYDIYRYILRIKAIDLKNGRVFRIVKWLHRNFQLPAFNMRQGGIHKNVLLIYIFLSNTSQRLSDKTKQRRETTKKRHLTCFILNSKNNSKF